MIFCLFVVLSFAVPSAFGLVGQARNPGLRNTGSGNCWPLPCDFEESLQRSIQTDFQRSMQRSQPWSQFGASGANYYPSNPFESSGNQGYGNFDYSQQGPWGGYPGPNYGGAEQVRAAQLQAEAARRQASLQAEAAFRQAQAQSEAAWRQGQWARQQGYQGAGYGGNGYGGMEFVPGGRRGQVNTGEPSFGTGTGIGASNWVGGSISGPNNFGTGLGAGNPVEGSSRFGGSNVDTLWNSGNTQGANNNFNNGGSFQNWNTQQIQGNGQLGSEERPVGSFSGVSVGGTVALYLSQSVPTGKVRFEGETNILPLFVASVQPDGVLFVGPKPNSPGFMSRISEPIKAYASSNTLNQLKVAGASRIHMATALNGNAITVNAAGASRVEIPSGRVDSLIVEAEGASQISAFGLQAERVQVRAVGASRIQVSAAKTLAATAIGASQVLYRGSPQLGPISKVGVSTVAQVN